MSISLPAGGVSLPGPNNPATSFDTNLNIAKSSKIIADFLGAGGQGAIHKNDLQKIASNGNLAPEVSAAAAYMIRHGDVFTAIETHDVAGKDDFSGVWNFDWAAKGGLDGTSIEAIASMQDAFDSAITRSAEITERTTEAKTELDSSKQRPQN